MKNSHDIYIGATNAGTFIAASAESPYFCFEGKTEREAIDTAHRALSFYFGGEGTLAAPQPVVRKEATLTRVRRVRKEHFNPAHALAAE